MIPSKRKSFSRIREIQKVLVGIIFFCVSGFLKLRSLSNARTNEVLAEKFQLIRCGDFSPETPVDLKVLAEKRFQRKL
jgi:hypothetical protein